LEDRITVLDGEIPETKREEVICMSVRRVCVPSHEALTKFALLHYQQGHAVEQQGEDTVEVGNRDQSGIRFTPLIEAHVFAPKAGEPDKCNHCHGLKGEAEAYYHADVLKWEMHKAKVLKR